MQVLLEPAFKLTADFVERFHARLSGQHYGNRNESVPNYHPVHFERAVDVLHKSW